MVFVFLIKIRIIWFYTSSKHWEKTKTNRRKTEKITEVGGKKRETSRFKMKRKLKKRTDKNGKKRRNGRMNTCRRLKSRFEEERRQNSEMKMNGRGRNIH